MPDKEREPSYRWPSDRPGYRRAAQNGSQGSGGRPLFGIAEGGRWVAFGSVVSATVGLLVFVGAAVGFALGRGVGLGGVVTLSALAGIAGVLVGTRFALRLTTSRRTGLTWFARLLGESSGWRWDRPFRLSSGLALRP